MSEGGNGKSEAGRTRSSLPPSDFTFPPWINLLSVLLIAAGLSWLFWGPLWEGGSLIGGDLFPYFFPQKAFLADQLRAGVFPLWNPLTGHGYPTIAESQTGVCYPPDLLAYRFLSVTAAYNTIQILHYVLAFVGMWLLARRFECSLAGALLAALSFVYGWFPPRICLEWAIITGAYLPWTLWCAESFLQRRQPRYLLGLCVLLALQLLAGHFHLAFLTVLTLALYVPFRWRMLRQSDMETPFLAVGAVGGAMLVAFLLAAVQLAPTWELKLRSQRSAVSVEHQPAYGHLPPRYWSQVIVPWLWYPGDVDLLLEKLPHYAGGAGTNKVEAHLYFGMLPLILALGGLAAHWRNRSVTASGVRLLCLIGLAFLLYTPGWCLPVTQYLPGFNFFRGPGRYGLITSLAVALAAGDACTGILNRLRGSGRFLAATILLGVTAGDLWWVAQQSWYSVMLRGPVVEQRADSRLRQLLSQEPGPVRLFAPNANFANLLAVSSTPVYLGIGPQEYFDPQFTMPVSPKGGLDPMGDPAQIRWLQDAGVTHILSLDRLNAARWPVKLAWTGNDPLVNIAFRRINEPFFLYQLLDSRGRIAWENPADSEGTLTITGYAPHEIRVQSASMQGGRIVLTDLNYPGWHVTVDGQPVPAESTGMFRAVTVGPGSHEIVWTYRPGSVYWGGLSSACTLLILAAAAFVIWYTKPKPAVIDH